MALPSLSLQQRLAHQKITVALQANLSKLESAANKYNVAAKTVNRILSTLPVLIEEMDTAVSAFEKAANAADEFQRDVYLDLYSHSKKLADSPDAEKWEEDIAIDPSFIPPHERDIPGDIEIWDTGEIADARKGVGKFVSLPK